MLVYERRQKRPPLFLGPPRVPEAQRQNVLADNKAFMFERSLYNVECFQFVHRLLATAADLPEDLSAFGLTFTTTVVAHSFQNQVLRDLVAALLRIFAAYPQSCRAFLRRLVTAEVQNLCETLLVWTLHLKPSASEAASSCTASVGGFLLCSLLLCFSLLCLLRLAFVW